MDSQDLLWLKWVAGKFFSEYDLTWTRTESQVSHALSQVSSRAC